MGNHNVIMTFAFAPLFERLYVIWNNNKHLVPVVTAIWRARVCNREIHSNETEVRWGRRAVVVVVSVFWLLLFLLSEAVFLKYCFLYHRKSGRARNTNIDRKSVV